MAIGVLALLIVSAGLLICGATFYSESAEGSGRTALMAALVALVAYGAVATWAAGTSSVGARRALCVGTRCALVLASAATVGHTLEDFAALPAPAGSLLGVGSWALMFVGDRKSVV